MSLESELRAGGVVRYHALPEIPKQTIAEHTWRLIRILRHVWVGVPDHIIKHAECHDMDELWVGDIPAPVKKALGEDKVEELFASLHDYSPYTTLAVTGAECEQWERDLVSFCDRIELVDYCLPYSASPLVARVVHRGLGYAKTHLDDVKQAANAPQHVSFTIHKLWSTYDRKRPTSGRLPL